MRHVVGGGVAGAEPPHKGGPNRPDRPKKQWSVVRGGAYAGSELNAEWVGIVRCRRFKGLDPATDCGGGSALDAGDDDALDVVFLGNEEEDDAGRQNDEGGGHEEGPLDPVLALEEAEAEC